MTSPLKRIQEHPSEAKRLIGIDYNQFLSLVALAEIRHQQKQEEIELNKVRINEKGGGRKPEILADTGVCLCTRIFKKYRASRAKTAVLIPGFVYARVYLRQQPIFEILGLLFDVSKTKANEAFHYWGEI